MPDDDGHRWDPAPGDYTRIREHLLRQRGVPPGKVKLDSGRIVIEGADADGEGRPR